MHEFMTPGPITVEVRLAAGSADIVAEERADATVEILSSGDPDATQDPAASCRVELVGDRLVIAGPDVGLWFWRRSCQVHVRARVPIDSRLIVKTASAETRAHGRYAMARVSTASGATYLDQVTGPTVVNTASGNVRGGTFAGPVEIRGASADICLDRAGWNGPSDTTDGSPTGDAKTAGDATPPFASGGNIAIHVASGDIEVGHLGGTTRMNTASGRIHLANVHHGEVRTRSASGDISVGVAPGVRAWIDLSSVSGAVHSELPPEAAANPAGQAELGVYARTMSGSITVRKAHPA